MCNWIIYGELVDVHKEFFICDGHCPDENFLYPEQLAKASPSLTSKSDVSSTFVSDSRLTV